MGNSTITGEIVKKYLKDYPEMAKLTLAKLIYKENSQAFSSVEHVRSSIRYYSGQMGKKNRINADSKEFWDQKRGIPESFVEDWTPFIIPEVYKKLLILSDIHVPYHDRDALFLAVHQGVQEGCDAVLLNGDIMDFYQMSRYEKDPRKRGFSDEIEAGREFISWIRSIFQCPIYYKLGNHEERYQSYLRNKAPELLEVQEHQMSVLLKCGENRIEMIEDKRIIKFADLNILHGHEFQSGFGSPVNPAKSFHNKSNQNVLCGHVHRTSTHTEKNLDGKRITAWSTGCLCEQNPDYARINKYNQGFAIAERIEDKARVHNFVIEDGEVFYN